LLKIDNARDALTLFHYFRQVIANAPEGLREAVEEAVIDAVEEVATAVVDNDRRPASLDDIRAWPDVDDLLAEIGILYVLERAAEKQPYYAEYMALSSAFEEAILEANHLGDTGEDAEYPIEPDAPDGLWLSDAYSATVNEHGGMAVLAMTELKTADDVRAWVEKVSPFDPTPDD
jgi:hypothetical protein